MGEITDRVYKFKLGSSAIRIAKLQIGSDAAKQTTDIEVEAIAEECGKGENDVRIDLLAAVRELIRVSPIPKMPKTKSPTGRGK